MKAKISVLALTAVLLLSLSAKALAANSFNFLGETTWTVTINERETGPIAPFQITMTGAISKLGTNYYLFQGVAQIPEDNPFFLAGAGTLVNMPDQTQKLVLTLNTSQLHVDTVQPASSERDTGIMHVEIKPSDLSGTFYEIGHDFNRSGPSFDPPRFTAGTISRTGGSIILNPVAMAPLNSLLLD